MQLYMLNMLIVELDKAQQWTEAIVIHGNHIVR